MYFGDVILSIPAQMSVRLLCEENSLNSQGGSYIQTNEHTKFTGGTYTYGHTNEHTKFTGGDVHTNEHTKFSGGDVHTNEPTKFTGGDVHVVTYERTLRTDTH